MLRLARVLRNASIIASIFASSIMARDAGRGGLPPDVRATSLQTSSAMLPFPHPFGRMLRRAVSGVAAGALLFPAIARAQYQQPAAPIAQILDQPATPAVLLSPDKAHLVVLSWPGLPPIRTVAGFEYRLAGRRFDPKTSGPSRGTGYTGIAFQAVAGGAARSLAQAMPSGTTIGDVMWSPDGRRLAFTVTSDSAITL